MVSLLPLDVVMSSCDGWNCCSHLLPAEGEANPTPAEQRCMNLGPNDTTELLEPSDFPSREDH